MGGMEANKFQNIPKRHGDGFLICYEFNVWPDELGKVDYQGTAYACTFRYTMELLELAVQIVKVGHITDEKAPSESYYGKPKVALPPLVQMSHAEFLADAKPLMDATPHFKDGQLMEDARYILNKAKDEGHWRKNLHIRNSYASITKVLEAMKAGQTVYHGASSTDIRYWYDGAAGEYMALFVTTNPYTNEETRDERRMDEAGMRAELEALSDDELKRKLK